jgi:hypothetical protein
MSARRPALGLVVFILIAFGFTWIGRFWMLRTSGLGDPSVTFLFTAAPGAAGFIAAFVEGGWQGLKGFCARVFRLRFPLWVWPAALLLPFAAALLTFATHPDDLLHIAVPKRMSMFATISLLNLFTRPLAEEFGLRGYLLDWLCRHRLSPALAGLVIGPIWAAWYLPLFYDSLFAVPMLYYLLWITSASVILALVVTRARGSVLPSILGYLMLNATPMIFFALLPALPDERQPGGLPLALAMAAVASVLAFVWRGAKWPVRE